MTGPSLLAQCVYAAYLERVAAVIDDAPLDGADLFLHARALDLAGVAYLVDRLGVPPVALLCDDDGLGWPLLAAPVEFLGGRAPRFAWRPDDGAQALVTVCRETNGGGVDIAALSLRDGLVGTLDGLPAMLGEQDMADDPVAVHAGPLEWLRAARRGVVVLDRGRAHASLRGMREIVVSSVEAGDALRDALKVRLPKLLVA